MTTLSRNSFHRIATSYLEHGASNSSSSIHKSTLRATRLSVPFIRRYSTAPKDPKGPQSKKPRPDGVGRPAKGFEGLYSDGSPMSSNRSKFQLRLSKSDEEALEGLLGKLELGLPKSQVTILRQAIQDYKSQGKIPPEVRDVMDTLSKNGGTMSLATAATVVRMISKISRDYAAKHAEEGSARSQNQSQTSKSTSSKKDKKSDDKSGENFSWRDLTGQIDNGYILATTLVGYMLYRLVIPSENSKEITFQEFKSTFFDKGLVEKLTVLNGSKVRVDLHREATGRMYPESPAQHAGFRYYFSIGSVEAFEKNLDRAQNELNIPSSERIPVTYKGETVWMNVLLSLGPTVLLVAGVLYLARRGASGGSAGGILGIGKSKAKKFNHETAIGVRFKDVAGMDEAKAEIMEFVSFLKEPGQYQRLGAKIPRGALLSGPPGTGKTLLAKATAGESQVPFFSISGSEFVEIFVGVGASRVRDLFQNARKNAPCIIFIDEIDAVGKARGKGFGGNDEREGTLNQILTEMDGFNTSEQVVVLAGTNRPDVLDKALLRPGRFDRQIAIDRPTVEGRKQIFNVHLGKILTNENMEHLTGRLAALTPGFSGADIANCVNEAALVGKFTILLGLRYHANQHCLQPLAKTLPPSRSTTSNKPSSASSAASKRNPSSSTRKKSARSPTTKPATPSAAGSSNTPTPSSKSPSSPAAKAPWATRNTSPRATSTSRTSPS